MAATTASKSFATLLRQSKLITLGDFRNTTVVGKVFHVLNEDLYVDVGLKFNVVVKKPQQDSHLYVRGSTVKLRLIDYEIVDKFIGSENWTTLMEADAILLGLNSTPVGSKKSANKKTTATNISAVADQESISSDDKDAK